MRLASGSGGAVELSCSAVRVHQQGLIVLQGKIISLLIKNTSRVLAAWPVEGQVVWPPGQLYSDWGWAREGNYQLAQEIDTPGHLLSLPKPAGAASPGYF